MAKTTVRERAAELAELAKGLRLQQTYLGREHVSVDVAIALAEVAADYAGQLAEYSDAITRELTTLQREMRKL